MSTKRKTGKGACQALRLSEARLDELVEEARVDAYGESEQVTGIYTIMENHPSMPFKTQMTVIVERIDITVRKLWPVAENRCRCGKVSLELPRVRLRRRA